MNYCNVSVNKDGLASFMYDSIYRLDSTELRWLQSDCESAFQPRVIGWKIPTSRNVTFA